MSIHGKKPETDREFYRRRLSEYGRKAFEVVASAVLFYLVDFTVHALLTTLHIDNHAQPGKTVHQTITWMVAIGYLIYVISLLLPDASENLSETRNRLREHWRKSARQRKKPP